MGGLRAASRWSAPKASRLDQKALCLKEEQARPKPSYEGETKTPPRGARAASRWSAPKASKIQPERNQSPAFKPTPISGSSCIGNETSFQDHYSIGKCSNSSDSRLTVTVVDVSPRHALRILPASRQCRCSTGWSRLTK